MSIKTRFLIVSDTHGLEFPPGASPTEPVDVAIHCGDLTNKSSLQEFHAALRLLKNINAPLKLLIAGNHDVSLDEAALQRLVKEAIPPLDPDLAEKEHLAVRGLLTNEAVIMHGIRLLHEGTHKFMLTNGASLTVYASPYTPSLGNGGFQFKPDQGHDFAIRHDADVVITHGPPRGVLDRVPGSGSAGCKQLFEAIEHARPRLHCFGHIHEGWGAKLVTWRGEPPWLRGGTDDRRGLQTHFSAIDHDNSVNVASLGSVQLGRFDTPETAAEKMRRKACWDAQKQCRGSFCAGDLHTVTKGRQTLFVNASRGGPDDEKRPPWVVDIDLPATT